MLTLLKLIRAADEPKELRFLSDQRQNGSPQSSQDNLDHQQNTIYEKAGKNIGDYVLEHVP